MEKSTLVDESVLGAVEGSKVGVAAEERAVGLACGGEGCVNVGLVVAAAAEVDVVDCVFGQLT